MGKTNERIKALEDRVAALKAHPPQVIYYNSLQPAPYVIPPQGPFWSWKPSTFTILCGGKS